MGYETLIQDLIQSAQSRKEEILNRGRKEAEQIVSSATQKAERMEHEFQKILAHEVDQEKRSWKNRTQIEARSILLKSRVSLIDEILTHLKARLRSLTEDKDYPKAIKHLYQEILPELPKGDITIRADKKGAATLKTIVKDRSVRFEPLPEEELGGIEISDETGKLRILNTFNARLSKMRPQLLVEINQWILKHE